MSTCVNCGRHSTLLCDGVIITLSSGEHRYSYGFRPPMGVTSRTCDAPICRDCAVNVSTIHLNTSKGCRWDTRDHCPQCADAIAKRNAETARTQDGSL